MTVRLAALLEHPTDEVMAMRGTILRDDVGYFTAGLKHSRRISDHEFRELADLGNVLVVDSELPWELVCTDPSRTSAFWVGDAFAKEATVLGAPAPVGPREGTVQVPGGKFWLDLAGPIYHTAQYWLTDTLRRTLDLQSEDLTRLMVRVDGTAEPTRAALLRRSRNRARTLDRFVRADRDYGVSVSEQMLKERLSVVAAGAEAERVRVLAIVGHAQEGSHRFAQHLADSVAVRFIAFRDYFENEALRLHGHIDRASMQAAGAVIAQWRSPEAIAEGAILDELRMAEGRFRSAVVDGFRHPHIYEALKRVDQLEVSLCAFDAPGRPGADGIEENRPPTEVAADATEQEVGALASSADLRLPEEEGRAAALLSGAV